MTFIGFGAVSWRFALGSLAMTLTACSGQIGGASEGDFDGEPDPWSEPIPGEGGPTLGDRPFSPPPASMMRLTREQYHNSLRDVFGVDLPIPTSLEADETNRAFSSLSAAQVGTSPRGVEQYEEAALAVAEALLVRKQDVPLLRNCVASPTGDACVEPLVRTVGERLWRRPLSQVEVERYVALMNIAGEAPADREQGLKYVLAALMQSPHFLYVTFVGETDPVAGMQKLTSHELASRLSLFLWDSVPDEELLEAARTQTLLTPAGLEAEVERMLAAPRARALVTRFFGQSWKIDRLTAGSKDPSVFPDWSADLLRAYLEEFRRVLEDIVFERDADVRELLTGRYTYASSILNANYGSHVSGEAFERVALGPHHTGILTSGAVMAAHALSHRTSPTQRGLFVREQILCEEVPPPPDDVDTSEIKNGDPRLPIRERLREHRENPVCAGCHAAFDPIGLSFEAFDGMGRFRDSFNDAPIDTSGEIDGTPYDGPVALSKLLNERSGLSDCLAEQLLSFATGQEFGSAQEGAVHTAADALRKAEYSFKRLVLATVSSPAFRYFRAP